MKTIHIEEFKTLISNNNWYFQYNHEIEGCSYSQTKSMEVKEVYGKASKISTLGEIKITYTEKFSYIEFDSDTLYTDNENYHLEGAVIVDGDGNKIDDKELAKLLKANREFKAFDYYFI